MSNLIHRHKAILNELEKEGYIKISDLSKLFSVSTVTLRKDIKYLEEKRLLFHSHGGVSLYSSLTNERHIDEKEKVKVEEKLRIAEAAIRLLNPDDRIIVASGTTVLAFANKINTDIPLTIITSSLKISINLCYKHNIEVIQLGGAMRKSSASVIGPDAENFLNNLACSKLFLGIDGLDLDFGLTTSNIAEAHLNQAMIRASQKVIVLADSSKFGKKGFGRICDISQVHTIITDKNTPLNFVHAFQERGIDVILV
ncbi:MAG: DeoR/GlpR family DNA-binding transcription regulator [Bacteroidales bacterium]|jgi:DeoR family transcriptional regulator of aga operon|nr:DeoR/GlpR family DNA-binding transcription regulator [Bacteroidales bacterium]